MKRFAQGISVAGALLTIASSASAQSHHHRHHTGPQNTATPASSAPPAGASAAPDASSAAPANPAAGPAIEIVPIAEGESIGHRIARARELMSQVEFASVVGLVRPVRLAENLPSQIRTEATMLEVNALIGLDSTPAAIEVCRTAVRLSDYNPDVAHSQSPPIRQACHTAAEQARAELAQTRQIHINELRVTPGAVAWTPVHIDVEISGDLSGLEPRVEVTVGTNAPVVMVLQPSQPGHYVTTIDHNEAAPDTAVRAVTSVGDAYGVLARGASETNARVPHSEAAVRFALGSDEGPLNVDGRASGSSVTVGGVVPLPLGAHTLSVQTAGGNTSTAQVALHRGEIALITLHTTSVVSVRGIVKWGSTIGAVLFGVAGAVFQSQSSAERSQLVDLSSQREARTNMPTVVYGTVRQVDEASQRDQILAVASFGVAAALAALAVTMWALPAHEETPTPAARALRHRPHPQISFGLTSATVSIDF